MEGCNNVGIWITTCMRRVVNLLQATATRPRPSSWAPDGPGRSYTFSLTVSPLRSSQGRCTPEILSQNFKPNAYFYVVYKELGKDWDSILTELHDQGFTHRSIVQIRSLYLKVRKLPHLWFNRDIYIF